MNYIQKKKEKKTLEFLWLELLHSAVQPFLAVVQTNCHLCNLNKLELLDCRKRHNKHQLSHQQVELCSLVRKYTLCEKGRSLVLGWGVTSSSWRVLSATVLESQYILNGSAKFGYVNSWLIQAHIKSHLVLGPNSITFRKQQVECNPTETVIVIWNF